MRDRDDATAEGMLTRSYAAVLVARARRGASLTWTPEHLDMDIEAFQIMVARLNDLAAGGLVQVLERRQAPGRGNDWWDLVRFMRL